MASIDVNALLGSNIFGDDEIGASLQSQLTEITDSKAKPVERQKSAVERASEARAATRSKLDSDLTEWQGYVQANRRKEHLVFKDHTERGRRKLSTDTIVSRQEAETDLEKEIDSLLSGAGLSIDALEGKGAATEASVESAGLSKSDMQAMRVEIARNRARLYHMMAKQKRWKRIKSRAFRRLHKKTKATNERFIQETESQAPELLERDALTKEFEGGNEVEQSTQARAEADYDRAEELKLAAAGLLGEDESESSDDDDSSLEESGEGIEIAINGVSLAEAKKLLEKEQAAALRNLEAESQHAKKVSKPTFDEEWSDDSESQLSETSEDESTSESSEGDEEKAAEHVLDVTEAVEGVRDNTSVKEKQDLNRVNIEALLEEGDDDNDDTKQTGRIEEASAIEESDFSREKERILAEQLPAEKTIDDVLVAGWGSWTGEKIEEKRKANPEKRKIPKWAQRSLERQRKLRQTAMEGRADYGNDRLIINAKEFGTGTTAKYCADSLPHDFMGDGESYNAVFSKPIGRETTSSQRFSADILPKVMTQKGAVILPSTHGRRQAVANAKKSEARRDAVLRARMKLEKQKRQQNQLKKHAPKSVGATSRSKI